MGSSNFRGSQSGETETQRLYLDQSLVQSYGFYLRSFFFADALHSPMIRLQGFGVRLASSCAAMTMG